MIHPDNGLVFSGTGKPKAKTFLGYEDAEVVPFRIG